MTDDKQHIPKLSNVPVYTITCNVLLHNTKLVKCWHSQRKRSYHCKSFRRAPAACRIPTPRRSAIGRCRSECLPRASRVHEGIPGRWNHRSSEASHILKSHRNRKFVLQNTFSNFRLSEYDCSVYQYRKHHIIGMITSLEA